MSGGSLLVADVGAMILMGLINPYISQKDKREIMESQFYLLEKPRIYFGYRFNPLLAFFVSCIFMFIALVIFFTSGDFAVVAGYFGNSLFSRICAAIIIVYVSVIIDVLASCLELIMEFVKCKICSFIYKDDAVLIK